MSWFYFFGKLNFWKFKASKRVANNLRDALSGELTENSKLMQKITKDLENKGHVVAEHPLGF
jgi:hypothetical protein